MRSLQWPVRPLSSPEPAPGERCRSQQHRRSTQEARTLARHFNPLCRHRHGMRKARPRRKCNYAAMCRRLAHSYEQEDSQRHVEAHHHRIASVRSGWISQSANQGKNGCGKKSPTTSSTTCNARSRHMATSLWPLIATDERLRKFCTARQLSSTIRRPKEGVPIQTPLNELTWQQSLPQPPSRTVRDILE